MQPGTDIWADIVTARILPYMSCDMTQFGANLNSEIKDEKSYEIKWTLNLYTHTHPATTSIVSCYISEIVRTEQSLRKYNNKQFIHLLFLQKLDWQRLLDEK